MYVGKWAAVGAVLLVFSGCAQTPTRPSGTAGAYTIGEIRQSSAPVPPRIGVGVPPAIGLTRYLAFGDSVTYGSLSGWDPRFLFASATGGYPSRLLAGLETHHAPQDFTVFNEGQPAEWAVDALARLQLKLTEHRPQAVLLLEGFNDLNNDVSIADTVTALRRMIDASLARGIPVIVATMYQTYVVTDPAGVEHPNAATRIQPFNVEVRKLPNGRLNVHLLDLYPLMNNRTYVGNDGVHPTEAGYDIMASAFLDAIERAFPVTRNTQ